MTRPHRDGIIPSLPTFYEAFSAHIDALLAWELAWDESWLHVDRGGSGYRLALSPRWRMEGTNRTDDGEPTFSGEGLLLPPNIEEGLRCAAGEQILPEGGFPETETEEDALAAGLCRELTWRHGTKYLLPIRCFSETSSADDSKKLFHWRFLNGHLALAVCLRVPGFDRLLDSHPQLAWLIARELWDCGALAAWSLGELRNLLRIDPIELLQVFGLPKRPTLLRILQKIHIGDLYPNLRYPLRRVARNEERLQRLLSFPPPLYAADIELQACEPLPTMELTRAIHEMAAEDPASGSGRECTGALAVQDYGWVATCGSDRAREALRQIKTPEQLFEEANLVDFDALLPET